MEALAVGTAAAAHDAFAAIEPGIVVIGLPLPDSHEFDLVRHFSATSACGVIVAAGAWAETAGIAGLEAGADDFIVKPAMLDNLVARVRAVNRRLQRSLAPSAPMRRDFSHAPQPNAPAITVDANHRCLVGPTGERTLLTEAEMSALETLLDAKGASVSREWLGRVALRRMIRVDDRSVDQLVMKLRRKLTTQGVSERAILSARRQGYVIPDPMLFRAASAVQSSQISAEMQLQPPLASYAAGPGDEQHYESGAHAASSHDRLAPPSIGATSRATRAW